MDYFEKRAVIIRDDTPLREWFVPEHIMHREGQQQEIARCLKPITLNRASRNVFMYGPCGTGKTLLAQWVMKELEAHSAQARTAYVNCWKRNTTHAALTEILSQLDVYVNYKQGTNDLFKVLEKEAAKHKVVVTLDEVDALETTELLYSLPRSGIGLVMISNDAYALLDVDARIKSSLAAEGVEFPAYTTEEVYDVLGDRKKYAFVPSSVGETVLKTAARLADGDCRIALETMRRAALLAEDADRETVTAEDVKNAFSSTKNLRKTEALKRLNPHEKALYLILEKQKELGTKELFTAYNSEVKEPASERSYRNYMNHLVRLGLVKAKGELTGRKYEHVI
ncbi:MAG: orc1/cdc6 family replication initiation protein [Candidatus Diapherotrites archaeon]|nr:orc1/cdc6 family replication initiation protein [Candidatus Diapherotrites archaeon]